MRYSVIDMFYLLFLFFILKNLFRIGWLHYGYTRRGFGKLYHHYVILVIVKFIYLPLINTRGETILFQFLLHYRVDNLLV